jgi:hypothetical protein
VFVTGETTAFVTLARTKPVCPRSWRNFHVSRILETSNDYLARCQTGLFWIRNSELATDFARQQIGNLCVAWYRGDPARVGQIYILAVLPSFLGKNTIKSLQVPDQFPPFHLYLELLDHHFTLRKFR